MPHRQVEEESIPLLTLYTPFGEQMSLYVDSSFAASGYEDPTRAGYTGHHMMNSIGIIHMGGRIYDASIGRFMQADPHIQAPNNTQNFNRYSYVLNNPMSYTDPTGFFFKKLFKAIGSNAFLSTIISIGLNFIPGCTGWCAAAATAAFNGAVTYAVTGSLKGALIGAFVGAVSPGGFTPGALLARGFLGGFASSVQGGKFGHGFIAAGAGGAANGISNVSVRILASAIIGGTVSKITGGKFANGAISASFATTVTAAFNGEFSRLSGDFKLFGTGSRAILTKTPDNHGDVLELFDGKVQLARWGSNDAKVSFSELQTVKSDLKSIFATEYGEAMLNALSVEAPLKILLNDYGSNGGLFGQNLMTVDIHSPIYFRNRAGSKEVVQASSARLIAHEMIHAVANIRSEGNTVQYTDQIMKSINRTSRETYGNSCKLDWSLLCR
ncbi:RHS repeat domain-containing protein [Ningiella sp. W23]|uniref:RHS repeat domain-containing protein n=1 Tax=Ningiella sp. W23 TaxID=3023715 RepID=UPI00375815B3